MNTIIYTPEEEISLKNELKDLVDNFKRIQQKLQHDKYKHLVKYINFKTPLLQSNVYNIITKTYWVLHNISDFPICANPNCTNKIGVNVNIQLSRKYPICCSKDCAAANPNRTTKIRQTALNKYGVDWPCKADIVKQSAKRSCFKKYGTTCVLQVPIIKDKARITCINKFGAPVANQFTSGDDILLQYQDNCIKKYGVEHPWKSKIVLKKRKQTWIDKYGVSNPSQFNEIQRKKQKKYIYDDINFDSAPELALYIYLKDHNVDFEYQPTAEFWYLVEGKTRKYMPDFKINNQYLEIKGSHLVDTKTGNWINPWNHNINSAAEAKHQCCLNNNVKIMYSTDYKQYLKYVAEKYGKDYIKQFKAC